MVISSHIVKERLSVVRLEYLLRSYLKSIPKDDLKFISLNYKYYVDITLGLT